jgi:hypothetical protein
MKSNIYINEIDNKMQKDGWKFLGPILHYKNAWKNQASVYEKNGIYEVCGIDSTGEKEIHERISKKEAENRVKESLKEISKFMFKKNKR